MRTISRKLIIALMAISMATFPALRANAQAGAAAGGIAGVGATTAVIVGLVVVGGLVSANNDNSGRPTTFAPIPEVPSDTNTATATSTSGGSTTTTTTN